MEVININGYDVKDKKAVRTYDTVALMKADNTLKQGYHIKTRGYYSINDGGGSEYYITTTQNQSEVQELLVNGLYANLIIENNTINIRQLGAQSQDTTNNKYDISSYLEKYENYVVNSLNRANLYIPSGIWYCSGYNFTHNKGFELFGDTTFPNSILSGTIISSLNDNQDYILKFGKENNRCDNCVIKNISFTSYDVIYENGFKYSTPKTVTNALMLWNACYTQVDNLFFIYIIGNALNIRSCWECYFGLLNFRQVSSYENGILTFDTADTSVNPGADTSANTFEKIMFECVHGHLIESKYHSGLCNTHFGVINFETNHFTVTDEDYILFNAEDISDYDDTTATHFSIFKGGMRIVVDSLEIMNLSRWFWKHSNNIYTYDRIIEPDVNRENYNGGSLILISINNIMSEGQLKDADIIYNNYYINRESGLYINNILNRNPFNLLLNVKGGFNINVNSSLNGYQALTDRNTHIENSFTPFYKVIHRNIGNSVTSGLLYYDSDSSNNLKLIVKPYSDTNIQHEQMNFLCSTRNIMLRAKIPENVDVDLLFINRDRISGSLTTTLTGTGDYTNYSVDISSICNVGDRISLRLANGETGKNVSLDYFGFI